jgi:hypothetical protein
MTGSTREDPARRNRCHYFTRLSLTKPRSIRRSFCLSVGALLLAGPPQLARQVPAQTDYDPPETEPRLQQTEFAGELRGDAARALPRLEKRGGLQILVQKRDLLPPT